MEVSLSRDVQAKLARLAAERGPDAEALAREAIERFVDDEWFIKQVERAWRKSPRGSADA